MARNGVTSVSSFEAFRSHFRQMLANGNHYIGRERCGAETVLKYSDGSCCVFNGDGRERAQIIGFTNSL